MRGWFSVLFLLFACGGDEHTCRVGADCPSGACRSDGTCVPVDTSSAGGSSSSMATSTSDSASASSASSGSGGAGGCGNGDGVIEASEVPLGPGLSAKYRVALDAPIDTAGVAESDGSRLWDLSIALSGDHLLLLETLTPAGTWFAPLFSGASYAARLSDEQDLLGVFEIAPSGLMLRGVVSPTDGPYRTELVHDPAVAVLSFPLDQGKSWQSNATVSGLTSGVFSYFTESYVSTVDAHGVVATPFGDFDVLRVHVELVRTVGVITTTVQTHVFVAECFGPVATIVSQDNEQATEFASAAEVRRLSP